MTRRDRIRLAFAFLLGAASLVAQPAAADGDAWARRLAGQPPGTLLRVRMDDGFTLEGHFAGVRADSLTLLPAAGGPAVGCPLAGVVAIRREASGAGHGWAVGSRVGAVAGALTGLFFAALVDAVEEGQSETEAAGYAVGAVGMASLGAVAAGGAGALIASGGRTWSDLPAAGPRRRQRLQVQAGAAIADGLDERNLQGPHLRCWLPRRVSAALDVGPEATWSGLGGELSSWDGRTAEIHDTWSVGLAARVSPAAAGLQPFASLGLGLYAREDAAPGLSLGTGLRWHRADGSGLDLEVRWHSGSSTVDSLPASGQWTVAGGWTFAL